MGKMLPPLGRRRLPRRRPADGKRQLVWRVDHRLLDEAYAYVDLEGLGTLQAVLNVLLARWVQMMRRDPTIQAKVTERARQVDMMAHPVNQVGPTPDLVITVRDADEAEALYDATGALIPEYRETETDL